MIKIIYGNLKEVKFLIKVNVLIMSSRIGLNVKKLLVCLRRGSEVAFSGGNK